MRIASRVLLSGIIETIIILIKFKREIALRVREL